MTRDVLLQKCLDNMHIYGCYAATIHNALTDKTFRDSVKWELQKGLKIPKTSLPAKQALLKEIADVEEAERQIRIAHPQMYFVMFDGPDGGHVMGPMAQNEIDSYFPKNKPKSAFCQEWPASVAGMGEEKYLVVKAEIIIPVIAKKRKKK